MIEAFETRALLSAKSFSFAISEHQVVNGVLQEEATLVYMRSASLENYGGKLHYAIGNLGNLVTTEELKTVTIVKVSGPAFAKN